MKRIKICNYLIIVCGIIFPANLLLCQNISQIVDSLQKAMNSSVGIERASLQIQIAEYYLNDLSKIEEAKRMADSSLQVSLACNDSSVIAYSWRLIGGYHRAKFQNDKALDCFLKSFSYCEKLGDKYRLQNLENDIGIIYINIKNYKKARAYFNNALTLSKELNATVKIAPQLLNIGATYYYQDSSELALNYFQRAYEIYKKTKDVRAATLLLNNIAGVYNDMKEHKKALETSKLALQSYEELKDTDGIAMCLINIGNEYNDMNNPKEGVLWVKKGLVIAQKLDDKQLVADSYKFLYESYKKIGDYENALINMEKLLAIRDTIYDSESNKSIADMQTRYDSEKKEKENQILKSNIEIKQLTNTRQKFIIYGVVFGILLLFVLTFFIYKNYKQSQRANSVLAEKNEIIEIKTKIVEEKSKDIIDSIRYAKRLQSAFLKPETNVNSCFPDAFILFKPKDILSGDFYWYEKFGNLSFVAAADCTGHGVPGALMSIMGCNLLSKAVNEYAITKPAAMLNSVNKGLAKILHQNSDGLSIKDGMDIALCVFDPEKMTLQYSGAYSPMWLIREGKLLEFKADKFPLGAFMDDKLHIFTNHEISVQKGDVVYIFSDGYADQFGGPEAKKFKYKQLQELFIENYSKPAIEQKYIIERVFESWIDDLEQMDDVLVIGVKI